MPKLEEVSPEEEAEWIRRAQRGDQQAFEHLVVAHQRYAYNLALRGVGDPQEAEDLAQEAFLRAWQGLPRFRSSARFGTWLYRIVINLCYNRLPGLRRELGALEAVEALEPQASQTIEDTAFTTSAGIDPLKAVLTEERMTYLQRQIEALPSSQQLIVLLRFVYECSYAEIATILDIPLGTVKTGVHRSRKQLQAALSALEEVLV